MHCVVTSELPSLSSVIFATTEDTEVLNAPVRELAASHSLICVCLVGKANGEAEKRASGQGG